MPAPDIASLLGAFGHLMNHGAPGRLYRELQPVLGRLAAEATTKWGMHLLVETQCYGCRRVSLSTCNACGQPACLHHAWMSTDADLLCHACAGKPKKARKKIPQPPPSPEPGVDAERMAALKELGLRPDASWEQIQTRFRELVAERHPDRFPPAKRLAAEERFKRTTAAYETLKRKAAA